MNNKTKRLMAVLLVLVFACSMILAGCGKKEGGAVEEKTLESIAKNDPKIQEELDGAFADSGLSGSTTIEGNVVKMNISIDDLLGDGFELDDSTKQLFQDSFDASFNDVEPDMQSSIADIEKGAGIKGVSIDIVITYKNEVVYTRTFTSGA